MASDKPNKGGGGNSDQRATARADKEPVEALAKEVLLQRHPSSEKISSKDLLLFCLTGVVALILFVVERTPVTVVVVLVCMFGLLVHPILNLSWVARAQNRRARGMRIVISAVVTIVSISIFGYWQWPKQSKLETQMQQIIEMVDSANEHLIPGDSNKMPSLASLGCKDDWVPKGAYLIRIGEMTQVVQQSDFPYVPLAVDIQNRGEVFATAHDFVKVSKSAEDLLVLSLNLRDKDGTIIVKFDEDGFVVGPQFLKRRPDKSTLIVTDVRGDEVLKAVYVTKSYLWLRAKIILNGELITNTSLFQHFCVPPVGEGGFRLFRPPS